ncbi:Arc family DNA-binding protein [Acinetobacter sp. 1124_18A]|uniref:Arc family DNA-binding protein n=1 Tax=Acinetobacter sp. 1124_18A TaxID=2605958 RepID=UPI0040594AA7
MSENQKEPQYKLRWNEDLRNKVMNSAKANNRSINQEIIVRLEESFQEDIEKYEDALKNAKLEFLLKELALRMGVFKITVSSTEDEYIQRQKEIEEMKRKELLVDDKKAP